MALRLNSEMVFGIASKVLGATTRPGWAWGSESSASSFIISTAVSNAVVVLQVVEIATAAFPLVLCITPGFNLMSINFADSSCNCCAI